MEKKFSKLGNYFKKGVKVGALTAAVLMGATACKPLADDQEEQQEQVQDLESYIFLRHRFAEENATISSSASEKDKIAWSNRHFNDAKDYMIAKVADFKHKVRDLEPAGNFLQPICDEIWTSKWDGSDFHGFENGGSGIDPILNYNNYNYDRFLGATGAKLAMANNMDYAYIRKFEAHYAALAVRAYNDSLGALHDSDRFQLNRERGEFNAALQGDPVNAPYTATDYTLIEQNLRGMLENVSRETGVSVGTLIDAVNLNLLNVGMCGARDLGATAGFQLSGTNTNLLRPQLPNLNRKDLLNNIGTWRMSYFIQYKDEQQSNQEQTQSR